MAFEYFIVLAACLAGPLVLSFSRKMDFYKSPMRLIISLGIPFLLFVVWDVIAAQRGHWFFNPKYITGNKIYNLPIEEILFFLVIPFCALFTWETVKYFRKGRQ